MTYDRLLEFGATTYIVFRAAPGLPEDFMPYGMEGRWDLRPDLDCPDIRLPGYRATAQARPAGRYERRDDGQYAEVWEVRPL